MAERGPRLARETQESGGPVLEMEDAIAEGEGRVASAAAALAGVDVEVVDRRRGDGDGRGEQEQRDDEARDDAEGPAPYCFVDA